MRQAKENYFIRTYDDTYHIEEEYSYTFDTKIQKEDVQHFNLSNKVCSELFIQDTKNDLFKSTFYLLQKKSPFTQVAFPLSSEQETNLIQIKMMYDILILHYVNEITVINLDENTQTNISIKTNNILVSSEFIYAYTDSTIFVYNLDGSFIKQENIEGEFIDMSYKDGLYLLIFKNRKYYVHYVNSNEEVHLSNVVADSRANSTREIKPNLELHATSDLRPYLDSNVIEHIETHDTTFLRDLASNTKITHFSMISKNNFIVLLDDNSLYYVDTINKRKELIFDREITEFGIDCQGRVWILSQNKIYRFKKDIRYKQVAVFYEKFYSYEDHTPWHSLVIDADIPKGTRMEVILDTEHGPTKPHINSKHFQKEAPLYVNEKNILLDKKIGPRLLVKISLYSDSTQVYTPILHSIKAVFDKSSYLEYLPAFYSQDSQSLYQYLAIFQTLMDETSTSIDTLADLLDLSTTNDEYLSWLSQWLGLVRDYRWSQDKWRLFLQRAPELYQKAGTKEGLSDIIELYSGNVPEIEEYMDEPEKRNENPFFFCVKIDADFSELEIAVITSIVEEFKPAYTQAKVVLNNNLKDNPNLILNESVLDYNSVIK